MTYGSENSDINRVETSGKSAAVVTGYSGLPGKRIVGKKVVRKARNYGNYVLPVGKSGTVKNADPDRKDTHGVLCGATGTSTGATHSFAKCRNCALP